MLQDDIHHLARAVDYLPEEQAGELLGIVLERLKDDTSAIIADIWLRVPALGGLSVLNLFVSREEPGRPKPDAVVINDKPESLLAWVAERNKPLWLDDITVGASSATNRLDGEPIVGHYLKVYHRTRCFAAVPISYRQQLRGVMSVETAISGRITRTHIDAMSALEEALGIVLWKCSVAKENYAHTKDAIFAFRQETAKSVLKPLAPYRAGFIARPFMTEFEPLEKAAKELFAKKHIQVRSYVHPPGKGLVIPEMLSLIHATHFGIADITALNDNVLVELGAMVSAGKPVLIFRKTEDSVQVPFDIAGYNFYRYSISGGDVVIYSPVESRGQRRLEDVVNAFIADVMMEDKTFTAAKEWLEM